MTKRLIAPKTTDGDWGAYVDEDNDAISIVSRVNGPSGGITGIDVARMPIPSETRTQKQINANARFLAGSKRTAEAAVALDAILDAIDDATKSLFAEMHIRGRPYVGPSWEDERKELRAALVAQGYSYSEQE
jgi:hypothetical protein